MRFYLDRLLVYIDGKFKCGNGKLSADFFFISSQNVIKMCLARDKAKAVTAEITDSKQQTFSKDRS